MVLVETPQKRMPPVGSIPTNVVQGHIISQVTQVTLLQWCVIWKGSERIPWYNSLPQVSSPKLKKWFMKII